MRVCCFCSKRLVISDMSNLLRSLRLLIRQRVWRWLDQRLPPVTRHTLRQRSLFVFPTSFGFSVVALVLLLYVLGTNYQNNLIILLSYLLLVLFIGSIVLAFLNLHHTSIEAKALAETHAGDTVQIQLQLERSKGLPQAFALGWQSQPLVLVTSSTLLMPIKTERRGFYQIPRLKIQSVFPFGLIRCWSYIRLDCRYWVFPAAIASPFNESQSDTQSDSQDEWAGLQQYQPGNSLRQLDWKRFSRQQQLLVHQYQAVALPSEELWLSPDPRLTGIEAQLSDITARALQAELRQQPFGLRIGQRHVAVGAGPAHLRKVLQELALC